MIRRIFMAGFVSAGVFLASGRVLTWFVKLEVPPEWDADQISFVDMESSINHVIEEEGRRPDGDRVNAVIEREYRSRGQGDLDKDAPDYLIVQLARRIAADKRFRLWNSPPIYLEKDDLPNGFGFYLNGEDGVSDSGGMDEDDVNSWGYQKKPYYEKRARRSMLIKYAVMAMVPTVLVFCVVLRVLRREEIEKKVWKPVKSLILFVGLPIGVCLALLMVAFSLMFGFPWSNSLYYYPSWKSELPSTATEINERGRGETWIGDYSYIMRAKVTKDEFLEFCAQLEMTPHSEDREYSDTYFEIRWGGNHPGCGGWWVPTDSLDGTYVWQEGQTTSYSKYEGGYLYFVSSKH